MLFLVDGYNVTQSDPATRDASLEEQRDALVARLRARGGVLLGRGRIVVVFDGPGGVGGSAVRATPVEVRFSRDEKADDLIVRLSKDATERVCLVSSDSALAARVDAVARHDAEVRGREVVFDAAGRGRGRPGSKRREVGDLGVPPGGNLITRELKEIWLSGEDEE